ncbi:hypothetical protein DFLDMN_001040 [Cupriavidus sp. H19C3]|uniref:hypothetical protein n=1 Tax=Cupriavidus sp. H19C3 TaxID=3241603 RepID=UPI003BF8F670
MKTPFSFRKFLHTRLGAAIWTLLVALLAYQFGQASNAQRLYRYESPKRFTSAGVEAVTLSNRQIIIAKIKANPGIRTPELADDTGIDSPASFIAGEIERNEILVTKVDNPHGGRPANSYRINPDNPPDETLAPRQRVVKASGHKVPASTEFSAALSSRGSLTISDGRKTVELTPSDTLGLVAYLDRINVDQVLKEAGVV